MSAVRVGRTRHRVLDDGRHQTTAIVSLGGVRERIWFQTPGDVPWLEHNRGDLWLPPLLVLAMRRGENLRLADPISAGRRARLREIQDIFCAWYPDRMRRVRIYAPEPENPQAEPRWRRWARRDRPPVPAIATCFTGGVDSFYTLVKHRESVGGLIYGLGLDIPGRHAGQARRVERMLQGVARDTGTRLLTARTNLRRLLDPRLSWGFEAHGAVLISLGTLFAPVFSRLYVPGTHSYADPVPWGSHPLVDPLWSTPRLQIRHDGAECTRVQKTRAIADDPVAQRNLRVCFARFADTNCGRCMKCLRTMATLALIDRLDRFETFPMPLDLERLRSFDLRTENAVVQLEDVYRLALEVDGHDEIRGTLAGMLEDFQARQATGLGVWRPGGPITPRG